MFLTMLVLFTVLARSPVICYPSFSEIAETPYFIIQLALSSSYRSLGEVREV